MTESELKSLLKQKYNRQNWKEIISGIFTNAEYFTSSHILAEKTETTKAVQQIGNLPITDGNIGIFEVEVSSRKNIARNRVELRKIASAYIDQDIINGAFVFYYSSNQDDYRFTFIAKKSGIAEDGELKRYQTQPKRYTYVLGPNESCTTAAKRLLELEHSVNISLDNVIQAFSLEKLNKEFFKKYKEHYQKLCDELAHSGFRKSVFNLQNFKDKKENDKAEKPIRDFVKLLLGRIVFLHFLQKKSWLGCPANSETWKEGDFQFLNNLYTNYKDKNHFLSKCLNYLFFATLNIKRDGDIFDFTNTRVPYLNGGLFDNVHPEYEQINFSVIRFEELFDFFSQYNFTIDESSPDEHEVGIDPEMLSHIFENLLEDNKDKGAFYTPKEIVHYMCHESLIQYLITNLSPLFLREQHKGGSEAAIQNFIHNQEVSQFIRDNAKEINSLLDKLKICDPAIGSGAFPMGLLKEIFQAKLLLYPYLKTNKRFDPAIVKRNILQNSIYGVDIDSGAVDIARLRFWLALIVDEEEPQLLPNLDYKIMQGNSLLESFEGIDLSNAFSDEFKITLVDPQINIFSGNVEDPQYQVNFTPLQKVLIKDLAEKYFKETDKAEKVKLHKNIEDYVLNHIELSLEFHKNKKTILLAQTRQELKERIKPINKLSARKQYLTKNKLLLRIEQLRKELKEIDSKYSKLEVLEETPERPYFLWHFYFKDVFDNGGFDIVIANPPYINIENLESSLKEYLYDNYDTCIRRTDIYVPFIDHSLSLLNKNGSLAFIIPYAFTNQKYGSALRKKIIENNHIIEILDTSEFFIFEATVKNIVLVISKQKKETLTSIKLVKSFYDFEQNNFVSHSLNQQSFTRLKDYRFETKPFLSNISLKEKITKDTLAFNEICFIAYGARINHRNKPITKDYYIHKEYKNGYKPFIEGKNIERYYHTQNGWLNYCPNEHYNSMFPELFENNKIMFINVVKDRLRFSFDNKQLYNSHTVINCVQWFLLKKSSHSSVKRNKNELRVIQSSNYDYMYLLAILNSKLINWYFLSFLSEKLHFYPDDAKQLPIKKLDKPKQINFISTAAKILECKLLDAQSDTQLFEDRIDIMVYKLYNLTYEEVKIIDPTFALTEKEYENFKIE